MPHVQLLSELRELRNAVTEGAFSHRTICAAIAALEAAPSGEPLAEGMSQLYRYVQVGPPEVRLDSIFFSDKSFGLETGGSRKVRVAIYGVGDA